MTKKNLVHQLETLLFRAYPGPFSRRKKITKTEFNRYIKLSSRHSEAALREAIGFVSQRLDPQGVQNASSAQHHQPTHDEGDHRPDPGKMYTAQFMFYADPGQLDADFAAGLQRKRRTARVRNLQLVQITHRRSVQVRATPEDIAPIPVQMYIHRDSDKTMFDHAIRILKTDENFKAQWERSNSPSLFHALYFQ